MAAELLWWLVSVAATIAVAYMVIRAAINGSVMRDTYREIRQLTDAQLRTARTLNEMNIELARIRRALEERDDEQRGSTT